jgi:hypothetical protein
VVVVVLVVVVVVVVPDGTAKSIQFVQTGLLEQTLTIVASFGILTK